MVWSVMLIWGGGGGEGVKKKRGEGEGWMRPLYTLPLHEPGDVSSMTIREALNL